MEPKRLFLLDAYALIYRAYYALMRSPRITSTGINTSAIFGFCNTLDEVLRKENPSHIAVCFDPPGGHTFRHDAYPAYKAQRDKQPEDITIAVPYIKRILEALAIPVVEVPGFEADDVIGTLSRMARGQGFDTFMMTPDKDYGQLVTPEVFMYRPALRGEGFEIRGPQQICERYGISRPAQVIDLLALEGDASDNIPGCPGVGEKTARRLIAEWDSVENLLENTESLKGALKKKIEENAEQIIFSKFLVTIKTDVPLPADLTIQSFERQPENVDLLASIYRELEFKTFLARLEKRTAAAVDTPAPPVPTSDGMGSLFDIPAPQPGAAFDSSAATVTDSPDAAARVIDAAAGKEVVAIAVAATGAEAMTARTLGIAVAADGIDPAYIPLPDDDHARAATLSAIAPLFSGQHPTIVSHDIKRDILLLRRLGITLDAPYFDTSIAHYILDPEAKHDLATVTARHLGVEPQFGPADPRRPYDDRLDTTAARNRYCERADLVLRLRPLLAEAVADEGMTPLLDDIELPLAGVLASMEWTGVRIDPAALAEMHSALAARLADMEAEAYSLAGHAFNIASPMQVGEVLFGELKIDTKVKKTARGAYSTTEQILEKYRAAHPLVDLILRIRRLRKLLTTYIDALPAMVNPATGKIHTSYNQTATATGRLSSSNPNLQNIPIRSTDGREIRRAFIADPGDLFMSADYSQIELRLMADMSADTGMVDAFLAGQDIHTATAAKIFHEDISAVTDDQRRRAKTANFGIIYGITPHGLSERLSIPRAEAKELIDGYFASYPHIRDYMDRTIGQARADGFVTTIMGRKRRIPDINSRNAVVRGYAERNAINAPIQGSAADIIKIAMVSVDRAITSRGLKSRMIMQVHDELIFNVVPDEAATLKEIVISSMENAYKGRVPLEVASGIGLNWLEAH